MEATRDAPARGRIALRRSSPALVLALLLATGTAPALRAQTCDDARQCTIDDVCVDGTCTGTPATGIPCNDGNSCTEGDSCFAGTCAGMPTSGGACDDHNECTSGDVCSAGQCTGTPLADDTPCSFGCGKCMGGKCEQDPEATKNLKPCTASDDPCLEEGFCAFGICLQLPKLCPDSDQNPCTLDVCDSASGECVNLGTSPCGDCESCVDSGANFECVPLAGRRPLRRRERVYRSRPVPDGSLRRDPPADPNTHADEHGHADCDSDCNTERDVDADGHRDRYGDAARHFHGRNGDRHGHTDADTHRHSNADGDSDLHRNGDRDAARPDAEQQRDGDRRAATATRPHRPSAPAIATATVRSPSTS